VAELHIAPKTAKGYIGKHLTNGGVFQLKQHFHPFLRNRWDIVQVRYTNDDALLYILFHVGICPRGGFMI